MNTESAVYQNFKELSDVARQADGDFKTFIKLKNAPTISPTPEPEEALSVEELGALLDSWVLDDIDDLESPKGEFKSVELWPYFDLATSFKKAIYGKKSSSPKKPYTRKKVILVNQYRNAATLTAIRLAIASQGGEKKAGFSSTISIPDLMPLIASKINTDSYYLDRSRQAGYFNKPPTFNDANNELKASFYQLALLDESEKIGQKLTPFTFDLTPDFVSKAFKNKKGFVEFTKRKIDRTLLSELGRHFKYWFVIEMAPLSGETRGHFRPHIHGAILLKDEELTSVNHRKTPISKAFNKVIGSCESDFSNRVLRLGNHADFAEKRNITVAAASLGWTRYIFDPADKKDKMPTRDRLFLGNNNLTADNQTKNLAKELYKTMSKKPQPVRTHRNYPNSIYFLN